MPEEIMSLSVSKIKTFCRCPLQFYYAHIMEIRSPIKIAFVSGKAGHKALENNFTYKVNEGTDMPTNNVCEIFSDSFDRGMKEEEVIENEPRYQVKDKTVNVLKLYHIEKAPKIKPKSLDFIERKFQLKFDNVPYVINGIIDLVDSKDRIVDYKFVGRKQDKEAMQFDPQLLCYPLGYHELTGKLPTKFCFDYLIKTIEPKLERIEFKQIDKSKVDWFLKLVGKIADAIKTGTFYPSGKSSGGFGSPCSWCGYSERCEAGEY